MDRATKANLRDAYDLAGHLLFATEDHLRTILIVLQTGPLPSYALYTLLRPAAEAAVRARQLVDPAISETDRLARALNERLDNLIEQRKAGVDPSHYKQRVAHLAKRATENGITVRWSAPKSGAPGEVIGFGEPIKSDLELFALHLPTGSTAFRFLSGHVHSKPWIQIRQHRAQPTADSRVSKVPTDVDIIVLASVLDSVLTVHDGNVGYWLSLAGYPLDIWREAKKSSS